MFGMAAVAGAGSTVCRPQRRNPAEDCNTTRTALLGGLPLAVWSASSKLKLFLLLLLLLGLGPYQAKRVAAQTAKSVVVYNGTQLFQALQDPAISLVLLGGSIKLDDDLWVINSCTINR